MRQVVEKPDARRAAAYLSTGEFRWNAGMFVVRANVLLDLLHRWHPELAQGLRAIAADPGRLEEVWPTLEKIAIDHAVAEPAADIGVVAVVPGDFAWHDIGDFSSLAALLPEPETGPRVLGDATLVHSVDSTGLVPPGRAPSCRFSMHVSYRPGDAVPSRTGAGAGLKQSSPLQRSSAGPPVRTGPNGSAPRWTQEDPGPCHFSA